MISKNYLINLDINSSTTAKTGIELVSQDTKVYSFRFIIYNGANVQDLTAIDHALIIFKKADNNVVQGNGIISATPTTGIIDYMLGSQEILCAGLVDGEIEFYGASGELITTSKFQFKVRESLLNDSSIQSTTEYRILTQLIEDIGSAPAGGGLLEFSNIEEFPTTGESGIIYADTSSNIIYRWSGIEYVAIGSGSSSSSSITLTTITPLTFSIATDADAILNYTFAKESGVSGVAKYYVDDTLVYTSAVVTGDVSFNIGSYLSAGANSVDVVVTDNGGGTATLTYLITAITLSLTSTFNNTVAYTGDISFKYTPVGNLSKTIHFVIDDVETYTATVSASGVQQTQTLSALTHGSHILEVYATAVIGEETITSNTLLYDIIAYEAENTTVIISSDFVTTTATQGNILNIGYRIYDPSNLTATAGLYTDATLNSTVTVDRTKHYWNITSYPVGDVEFSIVCGAVTKTFPVTVSAASVTVEVITDDLQLYLKSAGKSNSDSDRDEWVYETTECVLSDFNYSSNGWIINDDTETVLRINGDARVTVPYNLFGQDARLNGSTIEIVFSTRDVSDYTASLISCLQSAIGIDITAQLATFSSQQLSGDSAITTRYKEDEKIHLTIVIEPLSSNNIIYLYINGICSGLALYEDNDNFQQAVPVGITLGSNDAGLDVYVIRKYDAALNYQQVVNNYIADMSVLSTKISTYLANDVYDAYSEISYAKVSEILPCMTITGASPSYKGDKKTVSIAFSHTTDPTRDFSYAGCTIDIQGTSSQYYPRKNYKIKLPSYYSLRSTSIPEKTFCLKTDYMESSHSHNTGNAKMFGDIMLAVAPNPAQVIDPTIRSTVDGYIIAVFYRPTVNDDRECYGIFNFNNDKSDVTTFGYDADVECWEFCNNTSPKCLFQEAFTPQADVSTDFEARNPDTDPAYADYTGLSRVMSWVANTTVLPTDTLEEETAKLADFKTNIEDYFNLDSLLAYYCLSQLALTTDSLAKNLFLSSWRDDVTGQFLIWYPVWYDIDTSYGLNNEGALMFHYGYEYNDTIGTSNVFNGTHSTLWDNLVTCFPNEIKAMYIEIRNAGFDYDTVLETMWGEQVGQIPESMYNGDAQFKYIEPATEGTDGDTYFYVAQGSRFEHFKWWLNYRLKYLDSKFNTEDNLTDYATFRMYSPSETVVDPDGTFLVTTYADEYVNIKFGSSLVSVKVPRDTPTQVAPPVGINYNDTETIIYGVSNINELGDLSNKYIGTADFTKAVKLTKLEIGNSTTGYANTNLTGLSIGTNPLLSYLTVENCTALGGTVDVSGCLNLEEIYAKGTIITYLKLASGGNLKVLELPSTITTLKMINQQYITTFSMEGYDALTALRIENTPALDIETIVSSAPNLTRVRLVGVDWTLADSTLLETLMGLAGIDENDLNISTPIVTGTCHMDNVGSEMLGLLQTAFPELSISYGNLVSQYKITFKNWDDTVLDIQYVFSGGSASNPITREVNPIATPTKTATAQYYFTYLAWDSGLTNIFSNKIIKPTWTETLRNYTVRFYNGATLLQTSNNVDYGTNATYTGAIPTPPEGYLFDDWNPSPLNIQGATDCMAQFAKLTMPTTMKTLEEMTWAEIKALTNEGTIHSGGIYKNIEGVPPNNADIEYNSNIYADAGTTALSSNVYGIAFSPDSTKLVLGGYFTGNAKLYSVSESGVTFVSDIYADAGTTALSDVTRAMAFSPDGTKLVLGGAFSGKAKLYSVSESGVTFVSDIYADANTTALSATVYGIAFSPDSTKLVLGGSFSGSAKLYSVSENSVTFINNIYADAGTTALSSDSSSVAFSPDGTKLVLVGYFTGNAKLYSVSEGGVTFVSNIYADAGTTALNNGASSVAFSPDGLMLVLGGAFSGKAKLYSVSANSITFVSNIYADAGTTALSSTVYGIAFSPDSTKLVLGGAFSDYAKLYDYRTYTYWILVGDVKTITLSTAEELTLQVCDFEHDTITGTSDKAKITFGLKYTMATKKRMNATATNVGGWDTTELRAWMQTTLYPQLPLAVRSVLQQVNKSTTTGGSGGTTIVASTDFVFLFSTYEVNLTGSSYVTTQEKAVTAPYPVFTTAASRIIKKSNSGGSAVYWWLRTSNPSDAASFDAIKNAGYAAYSAANVTTHYIVFGFCV